MVPEGQWGHPVNTELLTCNHGDENTWHCLEVIRRARGSMGAAGCLSLAPPSTIYSLFSTLPLAFPHSFPLSRPLSLSLSHSTVLIAVQRFFVLLLLLCQESVLNMEIQAGQREEIKLSVPLWVLWLWASTELETSNISHTNTCKQTHASMVKWAPLAHLPNRKIIQAHFHMHLPHK